MPLTRHTTSASTSAQISDVNTSPVDSTYDANESAVIASLRATVQAILQVLRDHKLIGVPLAYTVSQSSVYGGVTSASYTNLTDSNSSTGTGTNNDSLSWVQADLGSVALVSSVSVAGGSLGGWGGVAAYLNGGLIQVSSDASTWVTVVSSISGVSDTGALTLFSFSTVSARYVRVARVGYLSLTELSIT